jgi:hypothetical protein
MSYPADNTNTEFKCLVDEVTRLQKILYDNGSKNESMESALRLMKAFSPRRYEELFLHE